MNNVWTSVSAWAQCSGRDCKECRSYYKTTECPIHIVNNQERVNFCRRLDKAIATLESSGFAVTEEDIVAIISASD